MSSHNYKNFNNICMYSPTTTIHNTARATRISKIDLTKAFEQITASKDYAP